VDHEPATVELEENEMNEEVKNEEQCQTREEDGNNEDE